MKTGFPKDFLWGGAMASSQAEGAFFAGRQGAGYAGSAVF